MKSLSLLCFLGLQVGVCSVALTGWAQAQDGAGLSGLDVASERERIAQARGVLERAEASAQTQCYRRFAVNDCLADVRRSYRAQRDELRRQENVLSEQQRRANAAQAHSRISEKIQAVQGTGPAAAASTTPLTPALPSLKLDDRQ